MASQSFLFESLHQGIFKSSTGRIGVWSEPQRGSAWLLLYCNILCHYVGLYTRQNARRGKSSTPVNDIFISLLILLCPHIHFADILLQIFFVVMPLILVFSLIWILQTISYLIIVIACEVAKPKHFYRFCQLSSYHSFFYASSSSYGSWKKRHSFISLH